MDYETLLTEQDQGVLRITLNRPERLNAWTYRMGAELSDAVNAANEDNDVIAMVITGAGRGFCAGADIQDEKVLGTCHLATGRDDHLGGDILPSMFKKHENSTHDDILFAPHKTPNFNIRQVRMIRGAQREVLIENFRPARYLLEALTNHG